MLFPDFFHKNSNNCLVNSCRVINFFSIDSASSAECEKRVLYNNQNHIPYQVRDLSLLASMPEFSIRKTDKIAY